MNKRSLEEAFTTVFHQKESFSDFCSLNIEQELTLFSVNGRELCRPSTKLKKYLRFIDKVMLRYLKQDNEVVHSYIKGKSSLTAVKAHSGNSHFFTTDIQSFFPNITKNNVEDILNKNIENIPVLGIENYISHISGMMTWRNTLPIGFPTSPQLSNAFLFNFDRALHQYCKENKYVYTRYSDDIIISSNSYEGFDNLSVVIQNLLSNKASPNLKLNEDKTRFLHTGNKVKILGLIITHSGTVTIDSKYKNQLESLLHFYVNDKTKFNKIIDETLEGKEHSLFGLLHYAKSIDPRYLEKLQRKYGAYALNSLMKDRWND